MTLEEQIKQTRKNRPSTIDELVALIKEDMEQSEQEQKDCSIRSANWAYQNGVQNALYETLRRIKWIGVEDK